MNTVLYVLHRFVAPFLMGLCMAAASVMTDVASVAFLASIGVVFGFLSLPLGVRALVRLADA
jgi:hypothetical protein